ncbi:hypothetical protein GON22_12765 [Paenibacillus sp. MMS18-CY102]|nr:hypothetical protein [Paenibacillus sp. MMS18-CY102]
MNKIALTTLAAALFMGTLLTSTADAKATTYKNCTELNKVYPGGVARAANVKNKGGKTKLKPYVSKELYDANKKSDRDNDLIACEK